MKKSILVACITSALNSGVIAEQQHSDFEAYVGASRYLFDSDRQLEDTSGLDLGGELAITEALSLEAWLSQADADVKNASGEVEGLRYSLGGLYHLSDEDLRPFLSLGVSHQGFEDANNEDHEETLAYIGAGVKKYFDNNLILRGELLGMNSIDNEVTDVAARLAVGYAFGRTTDSSVAEQISKAVQPVVAPAPKKAEPAPVQKQEPKPVAKVVEPPKDSDGDGVIDSNDQCADTNAAYKVDTKGCPVMLTEPVSIKLNVQFPTNSAEITPASLSEIKRVADFMKQFDQTRVTVEGHTDDRGRAAYNKALSQKRADAVRTALINEFGVAADRVSAKGYGEEQPVADNNTVEGRAENRRVVAIVEGKATKPVTK
ncbi:MAG: OmpA family protein [Oleiphilaceae bacterium]|nr:OmpA family protein [Oleiphilaceae bacterium]